MKNSYKKPLNVSKPNGERIVATVTQLGNGTVRIKLPIMYGADNRLLNMVVHQRNYPKAIHKIEKYLESLFLKELSNDNLHSSLKTKNESGRITESHSSRSEIKSGGKRPTESIHSGSRGNNPSKNSGRGSRKNELAEDHNPESEGSGKDRN